MVSEILYYTQIVTQTDILLLQYIGLLIKILGRESWSKSLHDLVICELKSQVRNTIH